ncbi:hypothetical protein FA15DRAFT_323523 [Coprinopsis marcescibilis]|uniref:DUF6533 domain-containing protein n=1 Tax=Coprinopsis marcescibilis TaxID=230819 RepID=A0A5C3KYV1_COPMA|nr:hypothetical protein FA15DRAFT_323523 [Coprinopsis marcescibilis]
MDQATLEALSTWTRIFYSSDAACLVLWTVDYLETVPLEIQLMWPPKTTLVNALYFALRYLPGIQFLVSILLSASSYGSPIPLCFPRSVAIAALTVLGVCASQALLFIRVYALAGCTPVLNVSMASIGAITWSALVALLAKYHVGLQIIEPPIPALACFQSSGQGYLVSIMWGIVLANELVMMTLTLASGWRQHRHSRSPLTGILYRNGSAYFAGIVASSVVNITVGLVAPRYVYPVGELQHTLHAIFATRMILHIREIAYREFGHGEITDADPGHQLAPLKFNRTRRPSASEFETQRNDHNNVDFATSPRGPRSNDVYSMI